MLLAGLGRGAATGALYGVLVVVVATVVDPPSGGAVADGASAILLFLILAGSWAGAYGALYAAVPGLLCAAVIAAAASLRPRRGLLVVLGAVVAGAVGWFWVDVVVAVGSGPPVEGTDDLLLWRVGPAAAGACGGAWQALRTEQWTRAAVR